LRPHPAAPLSPHSLWDVSKSADGSEPANGRGAGSLPQHRCGQVGSGREHRVLILPRIFVKSGSHGPRRGTWGRHDGGSGHFPQGSGAVAGEDPPRFRTGSITDRPASLDADTPPPDGNSLASSNSRPGDRRTLGNSLDTWAGETQLIIWEVFSPASRRDGTIATPLHKPDQG